MRKILTFTVGLTLVIGASRAEATTVALDDAIGTGTLTGVVGGVATFSSEFGGAGTGNFPAFVQIASPPGPSDTTSSAYNTTENNTLDNGSADTHNHALLLSSLAAVDGFYEFFLDINENNNADSRYLSLDDLVVVQSAAQNQSVQGIPAGTTVWDMKPGDNVLLNHAILEGSGNYDMKFLVPVSAFTGTADQTYVYLYSAFGAVGVVGDRNYGVFDGFEEWAARTGAGPAVPDGGVTAFMLGLSMLGLGFLKRRKD